VSLKTEDYYQDGKRWWFRFREKGGKLYQVPAHHTAEAYLDAYLLVGRVGEEKKSPLFQSVTRQGLLTGRQMTRNDALRMVKRRAATAGLPDSTCNHTFRATGITAYLSNGGTIENAQAIAAHESPRTTKLYDRTLDEITLDEIERIMILLLPPQLGLLLASGTSPPAAPLVTNMIPIRCGQFPDRPTDPTGGSPPVGFIFSHPADAKYHMNFITFKQYVEMQEGLLLPDRTPAKGLTRINPFPTTDAQRRRLTPKPVQASNPFKPTVRPVRQIVPNSIIPKLNRLRP
jgi:Phage integrase family